MGTFKLDYLGIPLDLYYHNLPCLNLNKYVEYYANLKKPPKAKFAGTSCKC